MKLNNTKKALILIVTFGMMVLNACSSDDPVKERNKNINKFYKKGQVNIAMVTSYGSARSMEILGTELALKKIKDEKICDVDINLITYEDRAKPNKAMNIAYEIASDKSIAAVIGHDFSDLSLPCSLIYQYYGIMMLNASSTIPSLTENNNKILFRNISTDTAAGQKAVELCQQKGFSKILIYNANSAYGNSLANAFELTASNNNIDIVNRDSFERKSSENTFVQKTKKWKNSYFFDAVFLVGTMPDISTILKVIRENGITVPVIGADSFENPLFFENLTEEENGRLYAISNYNLNSDYQPFVDFKNAFIEAYGIEPDLNACQGYDIMMVYAKALQEAKTAVPEKVAKVIRNNKWEEAAGPYTYNYRGDISGKEMLIKTFSNGMFTLE